MVYCCVPKCKSSSINKRAHFFRFPNSPIRKRKWNILCQQHKETNTFTRVCSDHFSPCCFEQKPIFGKSLPRLKPDAEPSLGDCSKGEHSHIDTSISTTTTSCQVGPTRFIQSVVEEKGSQPIPKYSVATDTNHLIKHRSKSSQTASSSISVGTQKSLHVSWCHASTQTPQYNLSDTAPHSRQTTEDEEWHETFEEEDDFYDVEEDSDGSESKYLPPNIQSVAFDDFQERPLYDHMEEQKFIVFHSNLLSLFTFCKICFSACKARIVKFCGSMVTVEVQCDSENDHIYTWNSQPIHNKLPLGNLALASSILFSGLSPTKGLRCLSFLNLKSISISTFKKIQRSYLVPCVTRVWERRQSALLRECTERPVRLAGDARCCSPGHSAKYGSYTLMDVDRNQVLDIELLQCNEVAISNAMELQGLKRGLYCLEEHGVTVADLITDRHCQVKAFMRKEKPAISHWFDAWHIAKGVYKKLVKLGKKKGLEVVGLWSHSISNHLYWCASSSNGDGDLVIAKWSSMLNHMANIHQGHSPLFPNCQHGDIEDRIWIAKGSRAYKEIEAVVNARCLLGDIGKTSHIGQTSSLEGFHNVICHFAPKFYHFHYAGMYARLRLSGLHYNENAKRKQAVDRQGEERWVLAYPKARHWEAVAKVQKTEQTFEYVSEIVKEVSAVRTTYPSCKKAYRALHVVNVPPSLTHTLANRKQKLDTIQCHKRRFPEQ